MVIVRNPLNMFFCATFLYMKRNHLSCIDIGVGNDPITKNSDKDILILAENANVVYPLSNASSNSKSSLSVKGCFG